MQYKLKAISPHKAGLLAGAVFGTTSLLFWPFFLISTLTMRSMDQQVGMKGMVAFMTFIGIAMPILYAVMGYVMTAFGCWLYNGYSKKLGNVVLTLEVKEEAAPLIGN